MSKLSIVPTPIGNFGDMTFRGIDTLNAVDYILAEDTRVTSKLLKHYDIKTPLKSYHSHNEHLKTESIIQLLSQDNHLALVSDAGTPGISDPGYLLVKSCIDHNIKIECLPGATSIIPAVILSGLPNHTFSFEGFLPVKKGRQKRLSELADSKQTMIFFESPRRISKTLNDFKIIFGGERAISISKELSKIYENTYRSDINSMIHIQKNILPKGEFIIVVSGKN